MHGMIMEGNSTDHHGWSYIVRVTEMGRLMLCYTRHIRKTQLMREQYLKEQIMKGIGCLKGTFTDTSSVEHNRVFIPYTASA